MKLKIKPNISLAKMFGLLLLLDGTRVFTFLWHLYCTIHSGLYTIVLMKTVSIPWKIVNGSTVFRKIKDLRGWNYEVFRKIAVHTITYFLSGEGLLVLTFLFRLKHKSLVPMGNMQLTHLLKKSFYN